MFAPSSWGLGGLTPTQMVPNGMICENVNNLTSASGCASVPDSLPCEICPRAPPYNIVAIPTVGEEEIVNQETTLSHHPPHPLLAIVNIYDYNLAASYGANPLGASSRECLFELNPSPSSFM
jgi:hypothetical protein